MSSGRKPSEAKHALTRPLSKKKQWFLEQKAIEFEESYQLRAIEARKVINHYQKKFGIKIYMNGDTDLGSAYIKSHQADIENEVKILKSNAHDDLIKKRIQTSAYNQYIEKMLSDADEVVVEKSKGRKVKGKTLKKMLTDSMQIAKELKDETVYQQNKKIFDNLPAFREKWLSEYNNANTMREQMNDANKLNRYLTFASHHLKSVSEEKPLDVVMSVKHRVG